MLLIDLIRHAESRMNLRNYLVQGRSDSTPLSDTGKGQVELLGRRLKNEGTKYSMIYSSPAVRALDTAKGAARHIGYPEEGIIIADDLQELDQGDWEGRLRLEVYTPEVIAEIKKDPWNFKSPTGESQKELEERVHGWMQRTLIAPYERGALRQHGEDPCVALFTHGFAIKCLLRKVMDFSPKTTYHVQTDNTSLTELVYSDGIWKIVCMNDSAHLR